MKSIAIAAAVGIAALSWAAPPASAGCLTGAILGGVAGHYAGHHGLLGAGAGCLIGRHYGKQSVRPQTNRPETYTAATRNRSTTIASRDQYGRPLARDRYGNLVSRNRYDPNQTTGFGSSSPLR